jgi:hypothetical protein
MALVPENQKGSNDLIGQALSRAQSEVAATQSAAKSETDFDTSMVMDDNDKEKLADNYFAKTDANARGRIHDLCDGMELTAMLLLQEAMRAADTKGDEHRILQVRMKLLTKLWDFRDTSDCEDDFDQDEFHAEMRVLAVIQRKLKGLDVKVKSLMQGGDESSSDSEGDGEKADLEKLKMARQTLRYACNEGSIPAA